METADHRQSGLRSQAAAEKARAKRRAETVRALTAEGWSCGEIAAEMGIHRDSVSRIRRENGIVPWIQINKGSL